MPETKTYSGSCHCGRVTYEADADLSQVISCNCSSCRRRGSLLAFVPDVKFRLKSGADALTQYEFNKKVIHYQFCETCGIQPFARGTRPDGVPIVALNVRCLEGVDLEALKIKKFDGAGL
ncbi:MAG TPA: GFA family protein [Hyphomicrobium sp.]|jgi:hypothetical protein